MKPLSLFCLTRGGLALARLLGEGLGGAELHLPQRLAPEACFSYGEVHPFRTLGEACWHGFAKSSGLIFIMAAGIVVRTLGPLLKDKRREPGVVVVDERGAYAISLLGGHRGGGNALAKRVASLTGGRAVITTASEVRGTLALDVMAERFGLVPEDGLTLRRVSLALVEGENVGFWAEAEIAPYLKGELESRKGVILHGTLEGLLSSGLKTLVLITDGFPSLNPPQERNFLYLRPRWLAVGVGCRKGVSAREVQAAVMGTLKERNLSPLSIRCLSSLDLKAHEEGLVAFSLAAELPIEYHSREAINGVKSIPNPSRLVREKVGVRGVCEPAALLSAPGGSLICPKRKWGRVTVAVARAPFLLSGSAPAPQNT